MCSSPAASHCKKQSPKPYTLWAAPAALSRKRISTNMITEIIVPDFRHHRGRSCTLQWLIEEGQLVVAGQPLFVVETDKATQEVEAFQGGYLRRILVAPGTTVEIGPWSPFCPTTLTSPWATSRNRQ